MTLGGIPQTQRFTLEPDTVFEHTFDDLQQSLHVDNLSNRWLYVPDLRRHIPPFTFGWQALLLPATRRIQIQPVTAPVDRGYLNLDATAHITIAVSTFPLPNSDGTTDVSGQDTPPIRPHIFGVNFTTDAVANTEATDLLIGTPDYGDYLGIIRLLYISARLRWLMNIEPITIEVFENGGSPICHLALTEQQPADNIVFPDGGIQTKYYTDFVTNGIHILHRSRGVGRTFRMSAGYYIDLQD